MLRPIGPFIQSEPSSNRIILQSDHSSDRTLRPTGHFAPKSDHSSNRITNLTRPIGPHVQSEQSPRIIEPLLRLYHFTCPIGPLARPIGSLVQSDNLTLGQSFNRITQLSANHRSLFANPRDGEGWRNIGGSHTRVRGTSANRCARCSGRRSFLVTMPTT